MIKKVVIWSLTVFWMGLLFYFSSHPGDTSSMQSGRLLALLGLIENNEILSNESAVKAMQFVIRKAGHIMGYFVLSVLVNLSINGLERVKSKYIISFIICVLYAISDEIHQTFVPGRSGEIKDVFIDSFGAAIGGMVVWVWNRRKVGRVG